MWNKLMKKFKIWLSAEAVIEYKACLYFACVLAFACFYSLYREIYYVSIPHLFEMILTAYFVGYLQVYALQNFDEAEQLDKKSAISALICTGLYTVVACLFEWFERNVVATVLFLSYMLLVYFCVYLVNKIKRAFDTEKLNGMLYEFKKEKMEGDESRNGQNRKKCD